MISRMLLRDLWTFSPSRHGLFNTFVHFVQFNSLLNIIADVSFPNLLEQTVARAMLNDVNGGFGNVRVTVAFDSVEH